MLHAVHYSALALLVGWQEEHPACKKIILLQQSPTVLFWRTSPDLEFPLCFNGHFPGGPGLAGIGMSLFWTWIGAKGDGGCGDNWSYKTCILRSKCHHQQTNTQFFTGWMPFQSCNQQCQGTEGIHLTRSYLWKLGRLNRSRSLVWAV